MELTVSQATLASELQVLSAVIDRKITIPVLAHVLVKAAPGATVLSATDLSNAIYARLNGEASVQQAGTAVLPVATLLGLVQRLAPCDVRIAVSKDHAQVTAGASKARLPLMAVEDFPASEPRR